MIYKEAANSTVYGLNKHSTFAQIMRALPKEDREYFTEFAKERDPKKRRKILETVSPLLGRSLNLMWYGKNKKKDNSKYFAHHYLPGITWSGWRPDVDLKDIEIKTIKNEGLLLSDFDIYDSEAKKPEVIFAPNIGPNKKSNNSALGLKFKLLGIMNGLGLRNVAIDVNPSSLMDTNINIDIVKTATAMVNHSIKKEIHDAFYGG